MTRNCKYGELVRPVTLPSGRKRYCKLKPRGSTKPQKSKRKSKRKSCNRFRKTKGDKCDDQDGCEWKVGKGCDKSKRKSKRKSKSKSKSKSKRKSKSKTSTLLGKIKPSSFKKLYQITYDIIRILEANDIPFFAAGGTALGAVRNKGIIPWDDDVDLGLLSKDKKEFVALKPVFAKCGYKMVKVWFGYKIMLTKAKLIKGLNWSYPFVDFFFVEKIDKKYQYDSKDARETWPKSHYKLDEFEPFQKIQFGDFMIPVVNNINKVLDRMYGKDWSTHGYREYDHEKEEPITSVKVKLSKAELEPAQPTKVVNRRCLDNIPQLSSSSSYSSIRKQIPIRKHVDGCNVSKECNLEKNMQVYVINCDKHTKRIAKFKKYAKIAGLPACKEICVDGKSFNENMIRQMVSEKLVKKQSYLTPVELSICLSHINVWQRFIDSCQEYALVIEDDAEVHKDFKKMLNKTLKALSKNDTSFDVLYLWNGNWSDTLDYTEEVLKVDKKITILRETRQFNAGAVAYIITKDMAKRMLKTAFPIEDAIDNYMGDFYNEKILSVKCKWNNKKECYISPLFRGTEWICGGEGGTGNTTQDYDTETVFDIMRKKKPRKKRKN